MDTVESKLFCIEKATILSEKLFRRIIRENELLVKGGSARKYCSYKEEISPEVPNIKQRNFRANR